MTNYSTDIKKIYQFIGNDVYKMDLDGNNEIIEAECKFFLKDNLDSLDLEDKSKANDVISAFWKSLNTNRAGKSIVSLDSKEIDSMSKKIEMYEKFDEYFNNTIIPNLSSNQYISDSESREKWVKSVKESLLNYVEDFMKKGGTADQLESYLTGKLDNKFYADPTRKNLAQLSMNKTTANIYAQQYIKEKIGEVGCKFEDLQKLLDNLVTKEIGDGDMTSDVISKVKALVDDYISQASGNYEFSEAAKKEKLSEYMVYVLKEHLTDILKSIEKEDGYSENKELYDSAVTSYIETMAGKTTKGEYNALMKLSYNEIIESAEFKDVKDKIAEAADLKTLPKDFWDNLPENIKVITGGTANYSVPNSYTTPNGVSIDSSRISFKTTNNSVLKIDSSGNVTVTGTSSASVNNVTVSVMLDGKEISSRKVTVTTEALKGSDLKIDASSFYYDEIEGYNENNNIYHTSKNSRETAKGYVYDDAKNLIENQLKPQLITRMKAKLKEMGVSYTTIIESAIDKALTNAFEDAFANNWGGHGKTWTKSANASINIKTLVDTTLTNFNQNIAKEYDKLVKYDGI